MKSALIFLCLSIVSCGQKPVATATTNNPAVPVSLLFEHDGIKVYRFEDNGRFHYYTDARGVVEWESGGKHSKHESISTVH